LKNLILDTNIILLDANSIFTVAADYPDYNICLPETVIEELDSKKTVVGEIGYQARSFGRMIANGTKVGESEAVQVKSRTGFGPTPRITITKYLVEGVTIRIVAASSYPLDTSTSPNLANDDKIMYIAEVLGGTLMSNDIMCRIRAEIKGTEVTDFKHVEHVDLEFNKTITVPHTVFNNLHNSSIVDIDKDYTQVTFSYMFASEDTGETKLATIHNGLIKILGKDTERDLRNQYVNPNNREQLLFSALVQDTSTDVTICESLAGSGKTLLSISNAMKLVGSDNTYDSIIYIRNSVDDVGNPDEEIGFLQGNDEKMSVYLQPFYDTVAQIVRMQTKSNLKGKALDIFLEEEAAVLIQKYNMSAIIALGLRGRTFDNSILIIDEAQNISKATMQKILSRVGKNSKVIVTGSLRQIDSKYLTKYTSGLSVLLDATNRTDLPIKLNAITLSKVVRGKITEFSEMLFSKIKDN
jgi:PhoH-like ATPase